VLDTTVLGAGCDRPREAINMRQRRVSGSGVSGAPWDLTAVRAWQVLGYQDGSLILDIKILGSLLFGPSTIDQCVVQGLYLSIILVYTSFCRLY
jgi:hypothetical protein